MPLHKLRTIIQLGKVVRRNNLYFLSGLWPEFWRIVRVAICKGLCEIINGRLKYRPLKLWFISSALGLYSWRQITWSPADPIGLESPWMFSPSLGWLSRPIDHVRSCAILSHGLNKQELPWQELPRQELPVLKPAGDQSLSFF